MPSSIKELFEACFEAPPAQRQQFLETIEDVETRKRLEELLDAHDDSDGLFEPETRQEAHDEGDIRRRLGHFRIGDVIGQGGMGIVYRAEQDRPRRVVALKTLPAGEIRTDRIVRFQAEADALARLEHPAITRIYEAGVIQDAGVDVPFIAMELVDGQELSRWAESTDAPLTERLELLVNLCAGVHHAHEQGVIHRDLKPSNVLVTRDGQPKVVDFGVARIIDRRSGLTRAGDVVGTLAYMSPEQAAGHDDEIDTRSDQYAVGVVAYELLTGSLPVPVRRLSVAEAAQMIEGHEPIPPSRLMKRLGTDIDFVLLRALAKDRADRYPSVAALGAELQKVIDGEPVEARTSAWAGLSRLVRRHRVASVLTCALLGVIATSIVMLASRNRDLQSALEKARRLRVEADEASLRANSAYRASEAERVRTSAIIEVVDDWLVYRHARDPWLDESTTLAELTDVYLQDLEVLGSDHVAFGYLNYLAGGLLKKTGRSSQACAQLEKALQLLAQSEETDHDRSLYLMSTMTFADAADGLRRSEQIIEVVEAAIPVAERLGPDLRKVWRARLDIELASHLIILDDYPSAGRTHAAVDANPATRDRRSRAERMIRSVHARLDEIDPDVKEIELRIDLAGRLARLGDHDSCYSVLHTLYASVATHPRYLGLQMLLNSLLAVSAVNRDRLDLAERHAVLAYERRKAAGLSRLQIIGGIKVYAFTSLQRGKLDRAEAAYGELLAYLGDEGPVIEIARARTNRAVVRRDQGKLDLALEDMDDAIGRLRRHDGSLVEFTLLEALTVRGEVALLARRNALARRSCEDASQLARDLHGVWSEEYFYARRNLARALGSARGDRGCPGDAHPDRADAEKAPFECFRTSTSTPRGAARHSGACQDQASRTAPVIGWRCDRREGVGAREDRSPREASVTLVFAA